MAGDHVNIRLELLTMPRAGAEYDYALTQSRRHGPAATLQKYSGTEGWERVNASAVGQLNVVATSARVESHYPVRVCITDGSDTVQFRVDGSTLGFVPVVICGLTKHNPDAGHSLWIQAGAGAWAQLDQHSQYATDYWQTNYIRDSDEYEIIFNVELFGRETHLAFGSKPTPTTAPTPSPTGTTTASPTPGSVPACPHTDMGECKAERGPWAWTCDNPRLRRHPGC